MNVKRLFNLRRLFILLTILALCAVFFVLTVHFIVREINQRREQITLKIKEEFGLPIYFDDIKTTWFGISLGISLQNVRIDDPTVPIPFLSIQTIKVYPDLSSIFFKDELQFKKLILQGLQLVMGWDKKNGLSVLGLKGESIPGTIEYTVLMKLLSKQKSIVIEDSEIVWQGPELKVKQFWSGEFKWIKSNNIDWMLKGEQRLQLREGVEIPSSKFMLSLSPDVKTIHLNVQGEALASQCHFIAKEDKSWTMDCKGDLHDLDINFFHQIYQPKQTDHLLLKWLADSLQAGRVTEAAIKVNGPLESLQTEGKIDFEDVEFQYASDWPMMQEATGHINIEKDKVKVQLSSGKLMDAEIEEAFALIAPIGSQKSPTVEVQGTVKGTLQDGVLFLKKSPLQQKLATHLEPLEPNGPMLLNLRLSIPLETNLSTKVEGDLVVEEAEIKIPHTNLLLEQLMGNFHFTENDIDSSNLSADFNHKPLNLQVKTLNVSKVPVLQVMTEGKFSADFLQEEFHLPLLEKLTGETLFTILVKYPLTAENQVSKTEWIVTSDLQGMAIELPGFLGKETNTVRPMRLAVSQDERNMWKMAFTLQNVLDSKILFEKKTDVYKLKRGHMTLGGKEAEWNTKENLFVNGEVKYFKAVDWQVFFEAMNQDKSRDFPKIDIHVFIDELELYGLKFDKTWVSSEFNGSPVQWKLNGPLIKGNISFPGSSKGDIAIDLEYLKIMTERISTKEALTVFSNKTEFPVVFDCKNLHIENGDFGEVSFKLSPSHYGYTIEYLKAETRFSELSGQGEWHLDEEHAYTTLEGKMMGVNMGETFSRWGYPSAIRESSGYIKYHFTWPTHPFQFDINIVEGSAELKFDKGRIIGVNPGLGRIMGLLNLENIRRRLQLDFSDLLKKGFVFDSLSGQFDFKDGTAYTKKLSIDGPSAKIELNGSANLKDKAIDLNMLVAPHMSMGIPLAGAIAAGPAGVAVGTGVWILDKLTGSRINKITEHKYRVTGTWDAPIIKELGSKELRGH